ncbi:MAG: LysM peptidoglycan-binding domain-containing protein [Deltaproteobacteria bacterium]|nr:LysM peptidoglycan-binding domain-containing protein [Deltaproteobacteria bacterium]
MRRLLSILAFVSLATASPAWAQQSFVVHVAKGDDTLPLLAAEYYGDRKLAVFIMVENKIRHPRQLRMGEHLRIPTAWKCIVSSGDSFKSLATQYLGDERRAAFLADFNGIAANTPLATGQELTIPFHVTHVAADRETLSSIAAAFYQDASKAALLAGYNFRSNRPLKPGESLIVPIVHVRIRESKLPAPDPEAIKREQKRRQQAEKVRNALPNAREAWLQGNYAEVRSVLTSDLDMDYLEPKTAAEVAFVLGGAYVALGDEDSALASFKKVLDRQPGFQVSAEETSPKVCRIWVRAGGKIIRP